MIVGHIPTTIGCGWSTAALHPIVAMRLRGAQCANALRLAPDVATANLWPHTQMTPRIEFVRYTLALASDALWCLCIRVRTPSVSGCEFHVQIFMSARPTLLGVGGRGGRPTGRYIDAIYAISPLDTE